MVRVGCGGGGGGGGGGGKGNKGTRSSYEEQNQLSLAEVLIAALKKSMMACHLDRDVDVISTVDNMEIGWPTNVEHIAHVTFDPFNGFLGLPVEFEVEVPCQVPSARYFFRYFLCFLFNFELVYVLVLLILFAGVFFGVFEI